MLFYGYLLILFIVAGICLAYSNGSDEQFWGSFFIGIIWPASILILIGIAIGSTIKGKED